MQILNEGLHKMDICEEWKDVLLDGVGERTLCHWKSSPLKWICEDEDRKEDGKHVPNAAGFRRRDATSTKVEKTNPRSRLTWCLAIVCRILVDSDYGQSDYKGLTCNRHVRYAAHFCTRHHVIVKRGHGYECHIRGGRNATLKLTSSPFVGMFVRKGQSIVDGEDLDFWHLDETPILLGILQGTNGT